jgi:hypothetical protein
MYLQFSLSSSSSKCSTHSISLLQKRASFFHAHSECFQHFSSTYSLKIGNGYRPTRRIATVNQNLFEKIKNCQPPTLNERTEKLLQQLKQGDRRALAKAITLGTK